MEDLVSGDTESILGSTETFVHGTADFSMVNCQPPPATHF
jgi:hypothetical protein